MARLQTLYEIFKEDSKFYFKLLQMDGKNYFNLNNPAHSTQT